MEEKIYSMPRIGDKAPEFKAVTTQGEINFPSDYSGSWVILFSHPADFTPVCTSEFMTFASMAAKFEKANTKLVGLSVDGLYSHIAWLRTIKEKIEYKGMKDVEVKFPLIEDITMSVAQKYGMMMPGAIEVSVSSGPRRLSELARKVRKGAILTFDLPYQGSPQALGAEDGFARAVSYAQFTHPLLKSNPDALALDLLAKEDPVAEPALQRITTAAKPTSDTCAGRTSPEH